MAWPRLPSESDPAAPDYTDYEFDNQADYEGLKRGLAAIIAHDKSNGTLTLWGTGIIFGSSVEMHVATATHVLTGIADSLLGAIPTNPIFGEDDRIRKELDRLPQLVKGSYLKVVVQTVEHRPTRVFDVVGFASGEVMGTDCALLQCAVPYVPGEEINFNVLMMDDEPIVVGEPVLMAGFIKPKCFSENDPATIPFADIHRAELFRGNLVVRASRVVEVTDNPGRVKSGAPHVRLAMPSIVGMSGGPVIRLRNVNHRRPVKLGEPIISTTVAIVSREAYGTDALGRTVEHTWSTPMVVLTSIIGYIKYIVITYQDLQAYLADNPRQLRGHRSRMFVEFRKILRHKGDRLKREERRSKRMNSSDHL